MPTLNRWTGSAWEEVMASPVVHTHSGTYVALVGGIVADGTTDNTATLQAAIDAAAAAGGGTLILSATVTPAITGKLTLKTKVHLQGSGWGTKLKLKNGTNDHMFVLENPLTTAFVEITDIALDGNRANQSTGSVIHIDNVGFTSGTSGWGTSNPHHKLERVYIEGAKLDGIHFADSSEGECRIDKVFVHGCGRYGFYVGGYDNFFSNCTSAGNDKQGFYLVGAPNHYVNCGAWFNGQGNPAVGDGDGWIIPSGHGHQLVDCYAQDNQGHGFYFVSCTDTICSGASSMRNGKGGAGSGFAIGGASGTAAKIFISGEAYDDGTVLTKTQEYALDIGPSTGGKNMVNLVSGSHKTGDLHGTPAVGSMVNIAGAQVGSSVWLGATQSATADLKTALVNIGVLPAGSPTGLNLNGGNLFTSGQVTGQTEVKSGSGSGAASVVVDGGAATARSTIFRTNTSNRWSVRANTTAEGGANAGSDFEVASFDDSGVAISSPLVIRRSDGRVTLGALVAAATTVTTLGTGGDVTLADGNNIVAGSTNGTKLGTATTQKLGFFNATPIVQPANTTDLRTMLINLGLLATGGASPLNLNGGTLTAAAVVASVGAASALVQLSAAAGQGRDVGFMTAGSNRWIVRVDSTAEGGSDAGSDFNIMSRTDAGGAKTTVLKIVRSTGVITLGGELITLASATGLAGFNLPHGAAPTSPVNGDMWTTTAGLFVRINGVTKTVTLT